MTRTSSGESFVLQHLLINAASRDSLNPNTVQGLELLNMGIGQRVLKLRVTEQPQHMICANLRYSHLEAGLAVFAA
jgi:hypothetical protein